jgi:hypothetical protein
MFDHQALSYASDLKSRQMVPKMTVERRLKNRALYIYVCAIHRTIFIHFRWMGREFIGSAKSTLHGSPQHRNMKASQLIAQNTQESSAELLHEEAELLDKF